jgi:hypothetical protein
MSISIGGALALLVPSVEGVVPAVVDKVLHVTTANSSSSIVQHTHTTSSTRTMYFFLNELNAILIREEPLDIRIIPFPLVCVLMMTNE